jgi:hypothetical protein
MWNQKARRQVRDIWNRKGDRRRCGIDMELKSKATGEEIAIE